MWFLRNKITHKILNNMISVCMAVHNGGQYLREQIDSILPQLGEKDEIIISDDGSTDDTLSVIRSFNDDRIKIYIYKQQNKSEHLHQYITQNFQNALQYAKGDYIFLSDQDDIWTADKVDVCIGYLEDNTLIVHDMQFVDNQKNPVGGGIMVTSISTIGSSNALPITDAQWHSVRSCCL